MYAWIEIALAKWPIAARDYSGGTCSGCGRTGFLWAKCKSTKDGWMPIHGFTFRYEKIPAEAVNRIALSYEETKCPCTAPKNE